jgi:hypothetical protein
VAPSSADAWALPEAGPDRSAQDDVVVAAATDAAQGGSFDHGGGAAGDDHGWHAPPAVTGPPLLPVPLKPMTISDILDGAWGVIKARPKSVLAITAVIILPVQVLSAYLQRNVRSTLDVLFAANNTDVFSQGQTGATSLSTVLLTYLAEALTVLCYYFLGYALARLVSAWYAGGDLTVKQTLIATAKKAHYITATFFLLLLPIAIARGTCVGSFFVIPLFMLAMPVMAIEGTNPWTSAMRSWKLVSRRLWWVMLYWFASLLIEELVNLAIEAAPGLVAIFSPAAARFLVPVAAAVAHFVTAPFVVGVPILIYLDLRVRTEGLDLELEAADAFAGAA